MLCTRPVTRFASHTGRGGARIKMFFRRRSYHPARRYRFAPYVPSRTPSAVPRYEKTFRAAPLKYFCHPGLRADSRMGPPETPIAHGCEALPSPLPETKHAPWPCSAGIASWRRGNPRIHPCPHTHLCEHHLLSATNPKLGRGVAWARRCHSVLESVPKLRNSTQQLE